ncbi:MAG TPA: hypothetical protein VGV40_03475 [Solirubrobacteraceae bacterium]|nr:hypothetical protein [Solirubrobacteraceae bacterium]
MVVLLAVTIGGLLAGIIGAALATPIAAAGVITGGFVREHSGRLHTAPSETSKPPVASAPGDG